MRNEAVVSRWGSRLAVRIPRAIARRVGLRAGDFVALSLDGDGGMVFRSGRRKYELVELVSGITPENRHRETWWE